MPLTFIHTADWQLGKPFARIADPEKRSLVRQERFRVIERIGAAARESDAAFILVAGDVFDSPMADKATVSRACSAIGGIERPVLIIPGNHDHAGPGCLWEQPFFIQEQQTLAPNLRVLLSPEPVELEGAVVFPCPLLSRHTPTDPTAWLRHLEDDFGDAPRIVLAHGSVQGFASSSSSADDEEDGSSPVPNLIDLDRLPREAIDYIALGDWHGTKQVAPHAWYAGTPEIDRFPRGDSNEPGHVLAVEVARGRPPKVTAVSTARLGWHGIDFTFAGDDDLERFEHALAETIGDRTERDLLRLTLGGSLGMEAATRLEAILATREARLLRLKLDDRTRIAPSEAELDALTRRPDDPLISRVAAGLAARAAADDDEDAAAARVALRELHAAVGMLS